MNKMFMNYNEDIKEICTSLCLFLKHNDLNSKKIIDYIMDLIKFYEINDAYFRKIEFTNNLKNKGVYIPEDKKLILNVEMLDAAYKLNFISYNQMIIDFLTLLLHEINHILQFRYRDIVCDDITKILNISYYLKLSSFNKIRILHDLFPDEIDSNIRASKVVYDMIGSELSEQNLIYFLKLSILYNDKIVCSPLEFLYNDILARNINETFENVNSIYYGLRKTQGLVDAIIDSYQTHILCVDIDGERRIKKCHK